MAGPRIVVSDDKLAPKSVDLERRINTFRWIKEWVETILREFPKLMGTRKSHIKEQNTLIVLLEKLNVVNKQLDELLKGGAPSEYIANFMEVNALDQKVIDALADMWRAAVGKQKKFLSSSQSYSSSGFINHLNETSGSHFARMCGIILQDVQVGNLYLKPEIFIPEVEKIYVVDTYHFMPDFETYHRKHPIAAIKKPGEKKSEEKEFSDRQLYLTIAKLIYVYEHMWIAQHELRLVPHEKELNVLRDLLSDLRSGEVPYVSGTKIQYRTNEMACRKILLDMFLTEARDHYDGSLEKFIKELNRSTENDKHMFWREIGLVLQDQFHEIPGARWDRRINRLMDYDVPEKLLIPSRPSYDR